MNAREAPRLMVLILSIFLPWPIKRFVLCRLLGFQIDPTARIGLSWIDSHRVILGPRAQVGHLTMIRNLDLLQVGQDSGIGSLNSISGHRAGSTYFRHQPDRRSELLLGSHSAITNRHYLDCSNRIIIGDFTTVAGVRSVWLTHSIDLRMNRQDTAPILIGDYCFVGAHSTVLLGARLPSHCVLGAHSLLRCAFTEEWRLYAGVPARELQPIEATWQYFCRSTGHVK